MGMWDWITKKELDEISEEVLRHQDAQEENFMKGQEKNFDKNIGKNLYVNDGSVKDSVKTLTFVHSILKNSLVDAVIRKFIMKHRDKLVKELPDEYQYEKLNLFSKAYDKALKDWTYKYQAFAYGKIKDKKESDAQYLDNTNGRLAILKEFYLTICANDSAYMEFHNMFMCSLRDELTKLDKSHCLYIDSTIHDTKYFIPVQRFTPDVQRVAKLIVDGYIRYAEVKYREDGTIDLVINENQMPTFVKNTDLPKGD